MDYLKSLAGHDDGEHTSTAQLYGVERVTDPSRTRGIYGHSRMINELKNLGEQIVLGMRMAASDGQVETSPGVFFEHFEPTEDAAFRSLLGISNESWLSSLAKPLEGGITKSSGKSGSLFWITHDSRYFVKSVPEVEANTLIEVLPSYRQHVEGAMSSGRLCLLPELLGIYCMYAADEKLYLQCFGNVFDTPEQPVRIYDLKGTTEDRYVEESPGHVMKDLNYEGKAIALPAQERKALLKACRADSEFLREHDIMDYSLLLGVYEKVGGKTGSGGLGSVSLRGCEVDEDDEEDSASKTPPVTFRMGIIDVGCAWTFKKVLAHMVKKPTLGACCSQEIDTEPPEYYANRFVHYVEEKIVDL